MHQVPFPGAIECAEAVYRTQEMSFFFKGSGGSGDTKNLNGSPNGFQLEKVMKKVQAGPDASSNVRWVGTGRTIFNNEQPEHPCAEASPERPGKRELLATLIRRGGRSRPRLLGSERHTVAEIDLSR